MLEKLKASIWILSLMSLSSCDDTPEKMFRYGNFQYCYMGSTLVGASSAVVDKDRDEISDEYAWKSGINEEHELYLRNYNVEDSTFILDIQRFAYCYVRACKKSTKFRMRTIHFYAKYSKELEYLDYDSAIASVCFENSSDRIKIETIFIGKKKYNGRDFPALDDIDIQPCEQMYRDLHRRQEHY